MRVIAGKYRSRPLLSLKGMDIRPTSDRLRETLFNVLTAGNPEALEGTIWIDFYAGTGAVGIEALSRGAEMVYFVESSVQAAELIARNLASLKIEQNFRILKLDALRGLRVPGERSCGGGFRLLRSAVSNAGGLSASLSALAQTGLLKAGRQ